jgi:hypothetical protein
VKDGAFIDSIKSTEVRTAKRNLHPQLRWKDGWLDKPICCEPIRTAHGRETSPEKGLTYATLHQDLSWLGEHCGFEEVLNVCALRQGTGNAVESKWLWSLSLPRPCTDS